MKEQYKFTNIKLNKSHVELTKSKIILTKLLFMDT